MIASSQSANAAEGDETIGLAYRVVDCGGGTSHPIGRRAVSVRKKIAASEESAGMSLAGPTGTKNTWVTVGSNGTTSSLILKNEDGREQTIKP